MYRLNTIISNPVKRGTGSADWSKFSALNPKLSCLVGFIMESSSLWSFSSSDNNKVDDSSKSWLSDAAKCVAMWHGGVKEVLPSVFSSWRQFFGATATKAFANRCLSFHWRNRIPKQQYSLNNRVKEAIVFVVSALFVVLVTAATSEECHQSLQVAKADEFSGRWGLRFIRACVRTSSWSARLLCSVSFCCLACLMYDSLHSDDSSSKCPSMGEEYLLYFISS